MVSGFVVKPHGSNNKKHSLTVLSSFADVVDELFHESIANSSACFGELQERSHAATSPLTRIDFIAGSPQLKTPDTNKAFASRSHDVA